MLRAALLDMYNGEDNRGIPMLKGILNDYSSELTFSQFDVRVNHEIPGLEFDIYLFSGGPGDPLEDDKPWVQPLYDLIWALWEHNKVAELTNQPKKYVFFICHSFQIACHCFGLGVVSERRQMSFGTYPVHKTHDGKEEPLFMPLPDPFYIADFRRYQVTQPNRQRFQQMNARILCLEKLRPHVHDERALMAIRFSPEIIGTQFHPEADPEGMLAHFLQPERQATIENEYGHARYQRMIRDLAHPNKIELTFNTIIPKFIEQSIAALQKTYAVV